MATAPLPLPDVSPIGRRTNRAWKFVRDWPIIPGIILTILVLTGLFAPWIAPHDPIGTDFAKRNTPPIFSSDWGGEFILGGDYVGRDVLSRLIHGARVSLLVVSVSLASGMLVGTALGLVSGYLGGLTDEIIMRLVDVFLALPFILLALVTVIVLGQNLAVLVGLLALVAWVPFVRNIRAEVLVIKTRDFVLMSRVTGASAARIMTKHILPNVANTILVIATLRVGGLILTESILSFLGAGIPPPTPAWGVMVSDGRNYLNDAWWISFFPGLAILLVVMSFNFIGDWLRDRLDPRLRQT